MNELGDTARRSLTNDGKRLAQAVSAAFGALPQVTTVAMAGSRIGPTQDDRSDVDLYVYVDEHIPADERIAIMHRFAERGEIDNRFWEPGDEWTDSASGIGVDLIYRTPCWIEAELDRVLIRHEASLGYSTCLWYNVLVSVPLYDRYGWFGQLRARRATVSHHVTSCHRSQEPPCLATHQLLVPTSAGTGPAAGRPRQRKPPPDSHLGGLL